MEAIGAATRAGVNLHTFDGEVVDAKTWSDTTVSGGGGGGDVNIGSGTVSPISIRSQTWTHNQFFVRNARGDERSFEFVNWGVATRPGHFVTVIWAIPEGRENGPYVAMYNHTTKDLSYNLAGMKTITRSGCAGIASIVVGTIFFLIPGLSAMIRGSASGVFLALIGFAWIGATVWMFSRSRKVGSGTLRSALDLKVAEIKAMPT